MLSHPQDGDSAIRSTDSDAALARLSAVQKGYLTDSFLKYLVPRAHFQPPRPPLINIGTHARAIAIDELVDQWMTVSKAETGRGCQIVSLGAGSDTRFWRIATSKLGDNLDLYIEVDFPELTTKKAMAIKKSKELLSVLDADPSQVRLANGGTSLHSKRYHLLPADLRLSPEDALKALISPAPGQSDTEGSDSILSRSIPTLLLFECVLVYMTPRASDALLDWFVGYFQFGAKAALGAVVYEMFGLQDPFGQVMLANMKTRNITLPGAAPYPNEASLPARFTRHGFHRAQALTLRDIRRNYISPVEVARTSKLEMLDELEELELVLAHYAITWGVKLSGSYGKTLSSTQWGGWALQPSPAEDTEDD